MIDDKYTYLGSGGVLVNRLNLRDDDRLDAALNDAASCSAGPAPEPSGPLFLF